MTSSVLSIREQLWPRDAEAIHALVAATGFFHEEEINIATELAKDAIQHGARSHYRFIVASEAGGQLSGYACYGQAPCTAASWDLYWIVVRPDLQGSGLGRQLLEMVESRVTSAGGTRVYVDTSSRDQYTPTRTFYCQAGYEMAAALPHFYGPGDGKIVFLKVLAP